MSSIAYLIKQAFKNIRKNILFSLASILTITVCIFVFCLFFAVVANLGVIINKAESTIGITVFFDEDLGSEGKDILKEEILSHGGIKEINYISADDAWEGFREEYFGDNSEELIEAFQGDNPLAKSDSFEIFMDNIEDESEEVGFLMSLDGVREVNYADSLIQSLKSLNKIIYMVSLIFVIILFAISIFLIANTINLSAQFRRSENEIMKLIGATKSMIRAPFVIEGIFLGLIGSTLPIISMYIIYERAILRVEEKLSAIGTLGALKDVVTFIPFNELMGLMIAVSLILGVGTGIITSIFTVNRQIKN